MNQKTKEKMYLASGDFIHRKIADVDVLISVGVNIADFNGYIELNESAIIIWRKLQQPCCLKELCEVLEERYGISKEDVMTDVLEFLDKLMNYNMVVEQ